MFFRCRSVYEFGTSCDLEIGYFIVPSATSLKLSMLTKFEAEYYIADNYNQLISKGIRKSSEISSFYSDFLLKPKMSTQNHHQGFCVDILLQFSKVNLVLYSKNSFVI